MEDDCFTVLVSALQRCESVIIVYISPPPWASHPSPIPPVYITERQTGLPVLHSDD